MALPWAVVLAAGSSERMGQPKQLLKLGGRTFVDLVVHAAGHHVVVVVGGEQADAVVAEVLDGVGDAGPASHTFVVNPDPSRGSWSSLRVVLDEFGDDDVVRPVVVLLADMPEVTRDITDKLVTEAEATNAWAALCEYNDGELAHPVYLSPDAQQAAREHDVPNRLWSLLVDDPPQPVLRVPIDRPRPLDVDTPEDYVELLRRAGHA